MGYGCDDDCNEEYSVIGEKEEVGFLDFEDDKSLCCFEPLEEGPVVISRPFPFIGRKQQSALIGETSADPITIRNTTDDPIDLWSVRIFSSNPEGSYALSLMKPPSADASEEEICRFMGLTGMEDRVIQPGRTLTIWLSCKPRDIGLHTSIIHFDTSDEKIERVAFLLAEDKVSRALISNKPYARALPRGKNFVMDHYVAGSRPQLPNTQRSKSNLPQHAIPENIRELVQNKQIPNVIMEGLNRKNYASFFSTLLAMEEIHLEVNKKE